MLLQHRRRLIIASVVGFGGLLMAASWLRRGPDVEQDVAPTETNTTAIESIDAQQLSPTRPSSITEVIELAEAALASMQDQLPDYTARFVKQERDESGSLSEKSEMRVKIQTRLRNESDDAPMRIYLKFIAPEATAGREVIWGKDLYDGQMAVHETTFLLSWKTLWLDPTGIAAMAGQRFPIYEIGLTRLVEKLIERGQADVGNPDVSVTITRDHEFDGLKCELIQAKRTKPGGGKDDFSLAEIVYDPERKLVLSYRSFGWPSEGQEVPLLESYEYLDLKTNVGLTDQDFDVANPDYQFPKL